MNETWDPNVWKISEEKPGYRVKTVQHGNCTIEIYRPILTDAERKKREAHVAAVAGSILASYYKRMEDKRSHEQPNHN